MAIKGISAPLEEETTIPANAKSQLDRAQNFSKFPPSFILKIIIGRSNVTGKKRTVLLGLVILILSKIDPGISFINKTPDVYAHSEYVITDLTL